MNNVDKVIADIEKEIKHVCSGGRITSAQIDFIHGQEYVLNRIRMAKSQKRTPKNKGITR